MREYNRNWRCELIDLDHPSRLTRIRAKHLQQRYGLTAAEFFVMWDAQDGSCAIADVKDSLHHGVLDIDHDHATGVVRGLLCRGCNNAVRWEEGRASGAAWATRRPVRVRERRAISDSLQEAVRAYIARWTPA